MRAAAFAVMSTLMVAACGGGGGSGGSVASPFDSARNARMKLVAIGRKNIAETSVISSNNVAVDAASGTIDAENELSYKGKLSPGRWITDDRGNRIRVSGNNRFVRQVMVTGADGTSYYAGALGSATTSVPTSGTARYNGTSTGFSRSYVEGQGLVTTEFTSKAALTADLSAGTGSYVISDVSARGGNAPFHRLGGSLTIDNGSIREKRGGDAFVQMTGGGKQHRIPFHSANGAFFGPGGIEAGVAYNVETFSSDSIPGSVTGVLTGAKQ